MGSPVRSCFAPFSHWADRVQLEASASSAQLYEGGGVSHPFSSAACAQSCCGLLEAIDSHRLGKECCKELLSDGVFRKLGEGIAADWEGISKRLVQRAGKKAHDPAWIQEDGQESIDAVHERLRRACCSSEVALLMLRLAVRSACLAGSWYGPWESVEALHQQLSMASAWTSLLRALKALLGAFQARLAKQYNAVNIVSDILHVSHALTSLCSTRHLLKHILVATLLQARGSCIPA